MDDNQEDITLRKKSWDIKDTCRLLQDEADAISSYTDKITESTERETLELAQLFEEIRLDEVEHIQKLCIQLTKLVTQPHEDKEEG